MLTKKWAVVRIQSYAIALFELPITGTSAYPDGAFVIATQVSHEHRSLNVPITCVNEHDFR